MNNPPQNPRSIAPPSRAASVSSSAARCSGDIFDVSITLGAVSGADSGGDFIGLILSV
jgi:hypothetical protein